RRRDGMGEPRRWRGAPATRGATYQGSAAGRGSIRHAEDAEELGELWAHRHVEPLAGRPALQEPFIVAVGEIAAFSELGEGALDDGGEFRLALAEHEAVGIVGEILADDMEIVAGLAGGNEAIEQNIVAGEGVGPARGQDLEGIGVVAAADDLDAELLLLGD